MCFSPEVSFTAGAAIAIIGFATLRKIEHREEILFASIPMLFANQQFIEGLLWLVLQKGGMPVQQYWLTQIYSGYAGVVWPTLIPLSIFLIEHEEVRKKALLVLFLIGVVIALYTVQGIIEYGINSRIINSCIQYDYPTDQSYYIKWVYLTVACLPLFLSRQPLLHKIGFISLLMFFVSYHMYHEVYVSVWCFFAAIISGLIYLYFREKYPLAYIEPKKINLLAHLHK